MHFIDLKTIEVSVLEKIIERSLVVKEAPKKAKGLLEDKKMYMLFEKTSTRTALSFGLGMNELGGIYFTQNRIDSNFTIGEIRDEVRYVAGNVDVIMARLKKNEDIVEMAKYSTVPVINGCCNRRHPCQAMADILTVKEKFGTFDVKFLYIGILNNVFNSLAASLPRLGGELTSIMPIENEASVDRELIDMAKKNGRYRNIDSKNISKSELKDIVNNSDVIYTDTWVDMEYFTDPSFENEKNERMEIMGPYQLNKELLKDFKGIIMHDMPIHPGYEITRDVVEEHMETILQQAENRRHAQKGILLTLLEDDKIRSFFGD